MAKPVEVVRELPEGSLERSHKIATRLEFMVDNHVEHVATELIDGTCTYDSTSLVRGRIDVSCVADIPELVSTRWDSLRAPSGTELRAYRGIEFAHYTALVLLGTFRIESSRLSRSSTELRVEISGQDRFSRFTGGDNTMETGGQIQAGTDAVDAIKFLLADADPDIDVSLLAYADYPLPLLSYQEGDDLGGLVQGIAGAIGAEIYMTRDGKPYMRAIPDPVEGSPAATIEEGGTMVNLEHALDRADIYNRVIATGVNTSNDEAQPVPRGVAVDSNPSSPTFYGGMNVFGRVFGKRTLAYPNSFITSNEQASLAAAGVLAQSMGAPDAVNFEAIVDPAREPGDIIRVSAPCLGFAWDHMLDGVTIPISQGQGMTGNTRATAAVAG